jgi:hypothetical protein
MGSPLAFSEDGGEGKEPEDAAEGQEEGASATKSLMSIFEDEVEVDTQLTSLNSWVEEVDAEELVDELRSIMEELQQLGTKPRS